MRAPSVSPSARRVPSDKRRPSYVFVHRRTIWYIPSPPFSEKPAACAVFCVGIECAYRFSIDGKPQAYSRRAKTAFDYAAVSIDGETLSVQPNGKLAAQWALLKLN